MGMIASALLATALGIVMALATLIAWRACGPRGSWLDASSPGRLFLVFFLVSTGFGSIVLILSGEGTGAGAALSAFGLLAFATGATIPARWRGIQDPIGRPVRVGRLRPSIVVALAAIGLAAYGAIAARHGIPFLTHDAQGVRATFTGLPFDIFRWLVPPGALVALAVALARGDRRSWVAAIAANGTLLIIMFLTASRALPFELATAALLLAWWAGRRISRRAWLALAAIALVFFVGVQLLRVKEEGGFSSLSDVARFAVARTFDRIALIQARSVEVVAAQIPGSEPFFGGTTYVRWIALLGGERPPQALGYWIYERIYPEQPGGFATPGILGELWANGGAPLALIGMAIFGAFVQWLGRLVGRLDQGVADRVFAALLVLAIARTYATSLNGLVLTLAVLVGWRIAITLPGLPEWLPFGVSRRWPQPADE